jgi:hypothetical protein
LMNRESWIVNREWGHGSPLDHDSRFMNHDSGFTIRSTAGTSRGGRASRRAPRPRRARSA